MATSIKFYIKITKRVKEKQSYPIYLRVVHNNSEEYLYETVNIPAENVFSADDLDYVNDLGYNYVDIAGAYLHTTDQIISYSEGIYGANSNVELLTVTGNMGKQTSSTFNLCDD